MFQIDGPECLKVLVTIKCSISTHPKDMKLFWTIGFIQFLDTKCCLHYDMNLYENLMFCENFLKNIVTCNHIHITVLVEDYSICPNESVHKRTLELSQIINFKFEKQISKRKVIFNTLR